MKRLLVLFMVALLGFGAFGALAEEEAKAATVAQLSENVREMLDHYGYKYTYDNSNHSYKLEFELDGILKSCVVKIYVYYDALEVFAIPDVTVPNKNLEKQAVAVALINDRNFYSQFGVDFDDNAFYARAVQFVEKTMPGFEELDTLFHMPMIDLERYGDVFYAVSQTGADPYEEVGKLD